VIAVGVRAGLPCGALVGPDPARCRGSPGRAAGARRPEAAHSPEAKRRAKVKQASRQGAARAGRVVLGTALGARCLYESVAGSLWCVTGGLGKGLPAQVCRPEVTDTPEAPRAAKAKLAEMGGMSRDERIMLGTMLGAVVLWVLGDSLGVPAVTAAMLGLCALLVSGVLTWRDCLTYTAARPLWRPLRRTGVLLGRHGALGLPAAMPSRWACACRSVRHALFPEWRHMPSSQQLPMARSKEVAQLCQAVRRPAAECSGRQHAPAR